MTVVPHHPPLIRRLLTDYKDAWQLRPSHLSKHTIAFVSIVYTHVQIYMRLLSSTIETTTVYIAGHTATALLYYYFICDISRKLYGHKQQYLLHCTASLQWNFVLSFIHSFITRVNDTNYFIAPQPKRRDRKLCIHEDHFEFYERSSYIQFIEWATILDWICELLFLLFSATIKASFRIIIESSHKGICNCDF